MKTLGCDSAFDFRYAKQEVHHMTKKKQQKNKIKTLHECYNFIQSFPFFLYVLKGILEVLDFTKSLFRVVYKESICMTSPVGF